MKEFDERLGEDTAAKSRSRSTAADDFAQLKEGLAAAQNKLTELDASQQTLSGGRRERARRIALVAG